MKIYPNKSGPSNEKNWTKLVGGDLTGSDPTLQRPWPRLELILQLENDPTFS